MRYIYSFNKGKFHLKLQIPDSPKCNLELYTLFTMSLPDLKKCIFHLAARPRGRTLNASGRTEIAQNCLSFVANSLSQQSGRIAIS